MINKCTCRKNYDIAKNKIIHEWTCPEHGYYYTWHEEV